MYIRALKFIWALDICSSYGFACCNLHRGVAYDVVWSQYGWTRFKQIVYIMLVRLMHLSYHWISCFGLSCVVVRLFLWPDLLQIYIHGDRLLTSLHKSLMRAQHHVTCASEYWTPMGAWNDGCSKQSKKLLQKAHRAMAVAVLIGMQRRLQQIHTSDGLKKVGVDEGVRVSLAPTLHNLTPL